METKHAAQVAAVVVLACVGVSGLTGCTPAPRDQARDTMVRLQEATKSMSARDAEKYSTNVKKLLCPESKDQMPDATNLLWGAPQFDWYTILGVTATNAPTGAEPSSYFQVVYIHGANPKPTPLPSDGGRYPSSVVRVDDDGTSCIYTLDGGPRKVR